MAKTDKTRRITISMNRAKCPRCGSECNRHSIGTRTLREIGITSPALLEVTYSKHFCKICCKHFSAQMDHIAPPSGRFTNRVREMSLDMIVNRGMSLGEAVKRMKDEYYVAVPVTTLHMWGKQAAKNY